jgi:hypothetical protein
VGVAKESCLHFFSKIVSPAFDTPGPRATLRHELPYMWPI